MTGEEIADSIAQRVTRAIHSFPPRFGLWEPGLEMVEEPANLYLTELGRLEAGDLTARESLEKLGNEIVLAFRRALRAWQQAGEP